MDLSLWGGFVAACLIVLAIPGPTVLLVCAYALSEGRRAGLAVTLGVALGDLVAMTASVLGLGALLLASGELFTVLRLLGAAYLIYLGWKMWRAPAASMAEGTASAERPSARRMAWRAFAVTATNPKGLVFFIAFVPQFIDQSAPLAPQLAILTATFVTLAAANAALYALLADRIRSRMTAPSALRWLNRIGGGTLMAMGLAAAAAQRSA